VPPPPAAGAPVGIEVCVGDAVAGVVNTVEGLADGLAVVVAVAVAVVPGVAVVVWPPLGLVLGATPLDVPLGVGLGEGTTEPETVIEGMVGAVVDEPPVHAETAVETRMASAPAPISLAPGVIPAMVVRSFIEPPRPPYAMVRFPVPASQTRIARNNARSIQSALALAKGGFRKRRRA
jgi:hypothetical protein